MKAGDGTDEIRRVDTYELKSRTPDHIISGKPKSHDGRIEEVCALCMIPSHFLSFQIRFAKMPI